MDFFEDITEDIISSIKMLSENCFRLRLYENKQIIFEKNYRTWKGAQYARAIRLRQKALKERNIGGIEK